MLRWRDLVIAYLGLLAITFAWALLGWAVLVIT